MSTRHSKELPHDVAVVKACRRILRPMIHGAIDQLTTGVFTPYKAIQRVKDPDYDGWLRDGVRKTLLRTGQFERIPDQN